MSRPANQPQRRRAFGEPTPSLAVVAAMLADVRADVADLTEKVDVLRMARSRSSGAASLLGSLVGTLLGSSVLGVIFSHVIK